MANNSKKIFIGTTDICGQIEDFSSGYKHEGFDVYTFVYNRAELYKDRKYSFVLNDLYWDKLLTTHNPFLIFIRKVYSLFVVKPVFYCILIWAITQCEIFHFMWITEKKWKYILPVLKIFKKKIIMSFVGSDIRWVPSFIQEFDMLNLGQNDPNESMRNTLRQKIVLEDKLMTLRVGEKYADLVLSGPDQSQLALRPYHHFYIPMEYKNIIFNVPENPVPVVLHASGERITYGTDAIEEMVNELRQEIDIPFKFLSYERIPHAQLLTLLSGADIFLYSPFMNGPGKLGLEALAAGCVLLTGYNKKYIQYPLDPPVVDITPENLKEKLRYYLMHNEERKYLAQKGRKWVEDNFDIHNITRRNLSNLFNPSTPEYFPTFFRDHATFISQWDSNDSIEICNKWTRYVNECGWYKNYVNPGERNGLHF